MGPKSRNYFKTSLKNKTGKLQTVKEESTVSMSETSPKKGTYSNSTFGKTLRG